MFFYLYFMTALPRLIGFCGFDLWPLTHPATLGTSTRRPEVGSDRVETRPFISSRLGEGHTRLGRCVDTSSPFVLFVLFIFSFLLTLFGTSSRHRHRPRPPSSPPQLSGEKEGNSRLLLPPETREMVFKWDAASPARRAKTPGEELKTAVGSRRRGDVESPAEFSYFCDEHVLGRFGVPWCRGVRLGQGTEARGKLDFFLKRLQARELYV